MSIPDLDGVQVLRLLEVVVVCIYLYNYARLIVRVSRLRCSADTCYNVCNICFSLYASPTLIQTNVSLFDTSPSPCLRVQLFTDFLSHTHIFRNTYCLTTPYFSREGLQILTMIVKPVFVER